MHIKRIYQKQSKLIFLVSNSRNAERDLRNVSAYQFLEMIQHLGQTDYIGAQTHFKSKTNDGWRPAADYTALSMITGYQLTHSALLSPTQPHLAPGRWPPDRCQSRWLFLSDSPGHWSRLGLPWKHRNLGGKLNKGKQGFPNPFSQFNSLEEKCHRCI